MARTRSSHRLPAALVMLVALAATTRGSGQSAAPADRQPTFPSSVDLVTVDVVVLDKQGKPVEGLSQNDFVVREDGDAQAISAFQAMTLRESPVTPRADQRVVATNSEDTDPTARWFFVVFDDVNVSQYSTPRARGVITQLIDRLLRQGDHVMIVPASGGTWWTGQLPEDRDSLVAYVNRLAGGYRPDTTAAHMWDHEAMAIALGRDKQVLGQVARRYFENSVIPESYPTDAEISRDLDVSPGLALIQAKAREVYRIATNRLRLSLEAMARLSDALAQRRGRKTLLLVSEGFIMDPAQTEFRTLVESARRSNTVVHFIDVRSPEGMLGQPGMAGGGAEFMAPVDEQDTSATMALATVAANGARSIALDTGGSIVQGSDLMIGLTKVVQQSRSHYLLGYTSTNPKRDGRFRKIQVSVLGRTDVTLRARSGYYAPGGREAKAPPADKLDSAVRAGLDSPFGASGIPLRLTSYVFEPQGGGGTVRTLLTAEADLTPLRLQAKAGTVEATLDSYVLVQSRDGGAPERQEKVVELNMPADVFERSRTGVPLMREFSLAPGEYQATLLVKDRATGTMGSVRHEFRVPAEGLRLSTPIITDVVQPPEAGRPPRPVPIARREFRAGTKVACAFEIYGAAAPAGGAPQVTVAYTLRRPDGTQVAAVPPQPIRAAGGRLAVTIGLTLPDTARGSHELVLVVHDDVAAKLVEVREPVIVVAP